MLALYAHRLGRDYGPDSSRAALVRALEQPLEGLETDVCLTADGELVLLHDPLLAVGTTLSGWAHERRASEICRARLRHRDGRPSREHPLLLGELLDVLPHAMTLQLEIKAYGDEALAHRTARAVCMHVDDHPARDRIEIISFWPAACEAAAALGHRARLVVIAGYEVAALAAWGRRIGLHGVGVEHFLLTPALVAKVRAAGLSVTTGTVNHPEMLAPLERLGIDAVTSDCPHALRRGLGQASSLPLAA